MEQEPLSLVEHQRWWHSRWMPAFWFGLGVVAMVSGIFIIDLIGTLLGF